MNSPSSSWKRSSTSLSSRQPSKSTGCGVEGSSTAVEPRIGSGPAGVDSATASLPDCTDDSRSSGLCESLTGLECISADGSSSDGSSSDGSSSDGSALDGSSSDGSALDGSSSDGSALDGSSSDGSALDGS